MTREGSGFLLQNVCPLCSTTVLFLVTRRKEKARLSLARGKIELGRFAMIFRTLTLNEDRREISKGRFGVPCEKITPASAHGEWGQVAVIGLLCEAREQSDMVPTSANALLSETASRMLTGLFALVSSSTWRAVRGSVMVSDQRLPQALPTWTEAFYTLPVACERFLHPLCVIEVAVGPSLSRGLCWFAGDLI